MPEFTSELWSQPGGRDGPGIPRIPDIGIGMLINYNHTNYMLCGIKQNMPVSTTIYFCKW